MGKTKRDIYKQLNDEGFNISKDVDLQDLRNVMLKSERTTDEQDRLAMYVNNIVSIVLHSAKICGYPDDIKSEIRADGFLDAMNAAPHFNAEYTAPTAPFSYLYRVIFNKATKVLKKYYKQRYVPFSSIDGDYESTLAAAEDDEVIEQPIADDFDASSYIVNWRRLQLKPRIKNAKGQCELFLFA